MRKVFKYLIQQADSGEASVRMPAGAEILSFQAEGAALTVWAMVDPEAPAVQRKFLVFGTGQPIEDSVANSLTYVGTARVHDKQIVWHLFEVPPVVS